MPKLSRAATRLWITAYVVCVRMSKSPASYQRADVQPRNVLERPEARVRRGALAIEIEMLVIHRRLQCVVAMAVAVPDAIAFVDEHVVHLDREEHVERRVPRVGEHLGADAERIGALALIFDDVQARLANGAEIELQIIVAEILARPRPDGRTMSERRGAVGADSQQSRFARGAVVAIQLDHRDLLLPWRVADLAVRDDGRARPVRNCRAG